VIFEMVYASGGIAERLDARKYPFPVLYGPEQHKRDSFDTSIVIERDEKNSDTFGAPQGFVRNPRKAYTRKLAVLATIYAKSSLPQAMIGEHERLAEQLVDALAVAIDEWCSEAKAGEPEYTESRYLRRDELGDLETWPGRVYVLRFKIGRGVMARNYLGEGEPTGSLASKSQIKNRTDVRRVAAPDGELPETGCEDTP
jgi:hypothetical protein